MSVMPETISVDTGAIAKSMKFPSLREGFYRGTVKSAEKTVNDNSSNLGIKQVLAPLDGEGEMGTPTIRNLLTLPVANPGADGHTAPRTAGFIARYLGATNKDFVRVPKSVNGVYVDADGQEVSESARQEAEVAQAKQIGDFAVEAWNDPNILVGDEFYMQVIQDGEYRKVTFWSELPEDAELITDRASFRDDD